ncbi:MAG: PilZ domain-containing protein [Gammaproteobacteria bacterium]|nr:PilZ domain-containing protein [Gammaproteobacteria bacterium]
MSKLVEKRIHLRIPSSRPVVFWVNQKAVYATMTDFSKHGIGFITSETMPNHTLIEVHFDISIHYQGGEVKAFQFKAEVKHCLDIHERNHIGVKLDMPSVEYATIFNHLSAA